MKVRQKVISCLLTLVYLFAIVLVPYTPVYAGSTSDGSTGSILLQDDYESYAANSTAASVATASASAPGMNGYSWAFTGSSWSNIPASGNKYIYYNATSEGFAVAGNALWTDYSVQAKVQLGATGSYPGIVARYTDSSNYYMFRANKTSDNKFELSKMVGGTGTTLGTCSVTTATGAAETTGIWYDLKIVLIGNELKCYVNGNKVIDVYDSSLTAGKAGFRSRWGKCCFDDFIVRDQRTLSDDFEGSGYNSWSSISGNWSVTNDVYTAGNHVYQQTAPSGTGYVYGGDSSMDDYSVRGRFMALDTGAKMGIVTRSADENNNYLFRLSFGSPNTAELLKAVGGSYTVIGTYTPTLALNTWYTLRVEAVGTNISCYINGTKVINATDSTFSSGKMGLWSTGGQGYIDDISVGPMFDPSVTDISLDGNDINASNVNGLTFKGFGVLSANSTSALLMDYKSQHPEAYAQMLQVLFGGTHPIMTSVKIEMGNDRNNSTGPEPATMRTADEPANVAREPGFQLAADAKKINPNIKVVILRWTAPAWANGNNSNIYTWYKNTILAVYRQYGYMVDYVNPGVNESAADLTWTKTYANMVKSDTTGFNDTTEQGLYNSIKVMISDEVGVGTFGNSILTDSDLMSAVAAAGYHYDTSDDSSGNFTKLAEQYDKEVWNSEAQATFSNTSFRPNNNMMDPSVAGTGIGGTGGPLEMGNTIIKGFTNSRRTNFIYQPAIGSFYEGAQYSSKELVSARDPWSGWIHYDGALVILQHFSRFANIGWENNTNTAGIWRAVPKASYTGASGTNPVNGRNGTPSYMTLAAPDKTNFSTVIINDSEYTKTYKIQTSNMAYSGTPSLEEWETRAADAGTAFNSNYMKYLGDVSANTEGVYTVHVKPYSIVTVTTLQKHSDPEYNTKLPVEGERTVLDTDATGDTQNTQDKILYADNFDYTNKTTAVIGAGGQIIGTQSYIDSRGGSKGATPRYTHDRNGGFEAYLPDGSSNYILRQQLDQPTMGLGGTWNNGNPRMAIGDFRWTNYKASVDVSFEDNSTYSGANYAQIGARYEGGNGSDNIGTAPYALKFWFDGGWQLLVNNSAVASGNVVNGTGGVAITDFNAAYNAWHNISIQVAGAKIDAFLDGEKLASYTDPNPKLSGRVDLGSGYYFTDFDNLKVETVDGYAPYYSEQLDDLEMYDLASVPNTKLIYTGSWTHSNGQGMWVYQRSISNSVAANDSLQYTFTGTGLDILGANDGTAKLDVTVDGQVIAKSASTIASQTLYQTYVLRGLKYAQHTVSIKVVSGKLAVDSVNVVSGEVKGTPDTTSLQTAVTAAQAFTKQPEFQQSDWDFFTSRLTDAQDALQNINTYRLDQEGADQLAARLSYAQNIMSTGDITSLATVYAATHVGKQPVLPSQVKATHQDSSESNVTVNWNLKGLNFNTPYQTIAVTGTYGILSTVCYVEVVPEDMEYFVNLNATKTGLGTGQTASNTLGYDSPAYVSIAALAAADGKPLLNGAPDQIYDGTNGWGYKGFDASGNPNIGYKGIVSGAFSKQSTTGVYTANQNGAYLVYNFDNLSAGKHTLTLGTYSWWSSYSRTEQVYIDHDGKSELVDTITLDSSSYDVTRGYVFNLEQAGSVKLRLVAAVSNQSPMLSFVGVAPYVENSTISSSTATFDKKTEAQTDITVTLSPNGNTLNNIKNAQTILTEGDQYTVSGSVYSIKKEYLATLPTGSTVLTFDMSAGVDPTLNLTIVDTNVDSTISPYAATFDKGTGTMTDVDVTVNFNGNTLNAIRNGSSTLVQGTDYTVAGSVYSIKSDYLSSFSAGTTVQLTFDFSSGYDSVIDISITDTSPVADATAPTWSGGTLAASNITRTGVTLTWSGASDNAGVTGYKIYQGTAELTTVAGSVYSCNITGLTAGTSYNFAVQAGDAANNWSTTGPTVSVTTLSAKHDSNTTSNTSINVKITPEGAVVAPASVNVDKGTGVVSATIDKAALDAALTQAIADTKGTKTVIVEIPKVDGATAYEQELPADVLTSVQATQRIAVSTELGKITAPSNMLSNTTGAAGAKVVTLGISQVDTSSLPIAVENTVGNRPIVELGVSVDGKKVEWNNPESPVTVSVPYKPTAEEQKDPEHIVVKYIDDAGNVNSIPSGRYNPASGEVIFTTTHLGQYSVAFVHKTFNDLDNYLWAEREIGIMTSKGIITGTTETTFTPEANINRADFTVLLVKTLGLTAKVASNFDDVKASDYYYNEVGIAKALGIIDGTGDDKFDPDQQISRQDMFVIAARAMKIANKIAASPVSTDLSTFKDKAYIADYAIPDITAMVNEGLVKGDNSIINPLGNATRAEAAVFLYRIYNK